MSNSITSDEIAAAFVSGSLLHGHEASVDEELDASDEAALERHMTAI